MNHQVLDARIRSNEQRLIGMATAALTTAAAGLIYGRMPGVAPLAGLALVGMPVAVVVSWAMAPSVVAAPVRWLLPMVIGTAIVGTVLGWAALSALAVGIGLLLAPVTAGSSVGLVLGVAFAGLVYTLPALMFVVPVTAMWVILLRLLVTFGRSESRPG